MLLAGIGGLLMSQGALETAASDPLVEEQHRLSYVLQQIDRQLRHLEATPRYFASDDAEPQTADEVAQQAVDLIRDEQIRALTAAHSEPYFGRIDFREPRQAAPTPIYIGKRGVEGGESGDRLVIDWRAPVASIFYSFSGKGDTAAYEAPDGVIEGNIHLKRNIVIRQHELQRVVDSYVHGQENLNVTDEFLLYRLSEQKDNRLRDIVSTIQAEQDKIIRADRGQAIVIQGVAGSGKTTVALHRIAFLLYQHADRLRADRMVIFAPNAMFVDYISEVLPELGVGGIQQTTFAEWALKVLDQRVALVSPADRLERWFGVNPDSKRTEELRLVKYKGSTQFIDVIDRYMTTLESTLVPQADFTAWEGVTLPADTIARWYSVEYRHYPLAGRRDRTLARIKRWYEMEYKTRRPSDPKGALKKQLAQRFRSYASRWHVLEPTGIYEGALQDAAAHHDGLPLTQISPLPRSKSKRPAVQLEDLAPLLYIHTKLYGVDSDYRFDHVVIDEAQDFSPMQIIVLQSYCPSQAFTILGDLSQSIHAYQGITDWQSFVKLFDADKAAYYQLDVSYRSTTEIIEFANRIVTRFPGFTLAKPVFRSGEPVRVCRVSEPERFNAVAESIRAFKNADANTIAVITRTEADAQAYQQGLCAVGIDSHLLTAHDQRYGGGISVLPVYLAKGLEFDGVVLVDVDEINYDDTPQSARLLYVGCTRALHHLYVQHTVDKSPLIAGGE